MLCFHYSLYFQQKFSSREFIFDVAEAKGFYKGPGEMAHGRKKEEPKLVVLLGRDFDRRTCSKSIRKALL